MNDPKEIDWDAVQCNGKNKKKADDVDGSLGADRDGPTTRESRRGETTRPQENG